MLKDLFPFDKEMKPVKNKYNELISEIKLLVEQARQSISQKINTELLLTYWNVGKLIVQRERQENIDEKSSRQLILELSKELSLHVGKGFSRSNLFAMRRFFQLYRFVQTVSGHFPVESVQTLSGQNMLTTKGKTKKTLKKQANVENIGKTISFQLSWSRPEIGLHELTCKQDEKIRKNHSRTRSKYLLLRVA